MKVEQFYALNQFHLYGEGKQCLQSYNSLVVKIENYTITLGRDWDYSTTTSKYVYMFLEEYTDLPISSEKNKRNYIRKLIENGTIMYDENMY